MSSEQNLAYKYYISFSANSANGVTSFNSRFISTEFELNTEEALVEIIDILTEKLNFIEGTLIINYIYPLKE